MGYCSRDKITNRKQDTAMPEEHALLIEKTVAAAAEAAAKAVVEAAQASALVLARSNTDTATSIAVLQSDMRNLQKQQSSLESEITKKIDGMSNEFDSINKALSEIVQGRPTWPVTIIIALLSTTTGSLIVGVIMHVLNGG